MVSGLQWFQDILGNQKTNSSSIYNTYKNTREKEDAGNYLILCVPKELLAFSWSFAFSPPPDSNSADGVTGRKLIS